MAAKKRKLKKENGKTGTVDSGCGIMYVTVNEKKEGDIKSYRVFIKPHEKAGGCFAAVMDATSRLTGLSVKHGAPMEKIVKHLKGIRCSKPIVNGASSCFDGIAIYLEEKYLKK